MTRWAVIACDQFTSEPAYWERCRAAVCGVPSAYDYIMPEAYLGTEREAAHAAEIGAAMASFDALLMRRIDGFVYLERTLPNGQLRRGIVGQIDLEAYDYHADSSSNAFPRGAESAHPPPSSCRISLSSSTTASG